MAEQYLYILISENYPQTYTGVTSDIPKRISEHNSGSNNYSRKYRPWKLFHSEEFATRKDVLARERYFKSHAGRNFLKKMMNDPR